MLEPDQKSTRSLGSEWSLRRNCRDPRVNPSARGSANDMLQLQQAGAKGRPQEHNRCIPDAVQWVPHCPGAVQCSRRIRTSSIPQRRSEGNDDTCSGDCKRYSWPLRSSSRQNAVSAFKDNVELSTVATP